ncbi:MAG TPA: S53 family peptidase [Pseudonocardiaceae bacterium]|nr:S53 family peptidase [Pseudonocardiaceae bacterium]
MRAHSGRRLAAALSGLAVAAATAGVGIATTTAVAASGVMTPSIAVSPAYKVAGHVASNPADTIFSCEQTVPAQCYGPNQIRAAYGVDKLAKVGLDGRGQTIVIVDAFQSPTITQDLASFDTAFGLPAPKLNIIAPDGLTPFDQSNADQTNWAGEISLDVEYSHAIAPAATIDLVLSKSDNDADIESAQKFVIDHNLGDTLSQSFGEAEQCEDPTILNNVHKLFQKAANERMTVFASSADQGAALPTCDGTSFFKAVSTPASDPIVTGVGGTILDADGITGAYHSETVWNEPDFNAAGGGGFSTLYKTPNFQRGLGLHTRGVPDISYNAAIIGGVLAVWSSSGLGANLVFQFGGTSAGSPQWAGLTALADQLGHRRIGAINDALYGLAHGPLYGALYHDITVGDNTFHGADITIQGFSAKKGWDAASGLGTPKANLLVPALVLATHGGPGKG